MSSLNSTKFYPPAEEKINIASHAAGLLLSLIGLVLLVGQAGNRDGGFLNLASFAVFGLSLVTLYSASTLYHSSRKPDTRKKLKIIDHAAIYLLIAGTYTPFTLITLRGTTGWIIFTVSWSFALMGIILKLFFTGKFTLFSTILYVFLGWIIIFAIKPLFRNLPTPGLVWLVTGGVAYTLGALLYSLKKLKFNHAIFHLFVLAGSFCHFMAVYFYVLPEK